MGLFDQEKQFSRETIRQFGVAAVQSLLNQNFIETVENFEKYFTSKGYGIFPDLDGDDGEMHYNYSIAKFNIGDIRGAIIEATKAIQRKRFYQAYKERAKYYNEIRDFDNAINDFSACIQLHPDDKAHYLCERGIAYFNLGNFESFIKDMVSSYELGDKNAEKILREKTNYFNR